jgi:hypothetical protein
VKDLNADPLIVRRQIAVAAIDQAVVAGVTEHGDDFALVVEEAPGAEGARQERVDAAREAELVAR